MSGFHRVKEGEHISLIAARNGFRDYRTVWDNAGNATLRQTRQNPNTLMPGDAVFVPDKTDRNEAAETGRRHVFFSHARHLMLRIVGLDVHRTAIVAASWTIQHEGGAASNVTTGAGLAETEIPVTARHGALTLSGNVLELDIGGLHPIEDESGCLQRLVNLGYLEGPPEEAAPAEIHSAVEEFECDQRLPLTGVCKGITRDALRDFHGC